MASLEEAIDRVTAGPKRKSVLLSEKERKIIAYHEGGHALVGHALPNADPVHKITIIPRGRALGYTAAAPTEDKFLVSRAEMMDQLAMLLGGRTAEELVFHEPTTGAANDIEKASPDRARHGHRVRHERAARRPQVRHRRRRAVPRPGDVAQPRDYSEEIASAIDDEVRTLIEAAHDEAWEILVQYRDVLDNLVLQLMEHETLSRDQVLEIFAPVQQAAVPRLLHRLRQAAAVGPAAGADAQGDWRWPAARRHRAARGRQRPGLRDRRRAPANGGTGPVGGSAPRCRTAHRHDGPAGSLDG